MAGLLTVDSTAEWKGYATQRIAFPFWPGRMTGCGNYFYKERKANGIGTGKARTLGYNESIQEKLYQKSMKQHCMSKQPHTQSIGGRT